MSAQTPFYGYYINLDERGEFFADVRDQGGNTVYEIHTEQAEELIIDGFVRDVRSPAQIAQHLRDAGIIAKDAQVYSMTHFESLLDRLNNQARRDEEEEDDYDF